MTGTFEGKNRLFSILALMYPLLPVSNNTAPKCMCIIFSQIRLKAYHSIYLHSEALQPRINSQRTCYQFIKLEIVKAKEEISQTKDDDVVRNVTIILQTDFQYDL
jgi:hypothetical protein